MRTTPASSSLAPTDILPEHDSVHADLLPGKRSESVHEADDARHDELHDGVMQHRRNIPCVLVGALTIALAACTSDVVDGTPPSTTTTTTTAVPVPTTEPQPVPTTDLEPEQTMATPESSERLLGGAEVAFATVACDELAAAPATCGTAAVPADWAKPNGSTIEVFYVVVPAASGASTGTVIPFAGGPGESITAQIERFAPLSGAVPDSDLLIVDVRGAGRSGALTCAVLDDASERAVGTRQVEDAARCAEQIGARRNHYTTVASVLDVESIRRGLGLERASLIGFSYGTFMAQTYTTLFPGDVRGAVLDGAYPTEQTGWNTDIPTSIEPVLERRCERTGACPDGAASVAASIRTVAASLAEAPVSLPGAEQELTEGMLANVIQFSLQDSSMESFVEMVSAAARGDLRALNEAALALVASIPVEPTAYSPALFHAVACNDYVAQFDVDDDVPVRRIDFEHRLEELPDDEFDMFSKQGWIGSGTDEGDMCLAWPTPDIAPELRIRRGVQRPDVPVLVVNGDIDMQTPLSGARRVAAAFPNSVLLVVPNAGHVALPVSECAARIEFAFLADPVLPDGDACLDQPVPE